MIKSQILFSDEVKTKTQQIMNPWFQMQKSICKMLGGKENECFVFGVKSEERTRVFVYTEMLMAAKIYRSHLKYPNTGMLVSLGQKH